MGHGCHTCGVPNGCHCDLLAVAAKHKHVPLPAPAPKEPGVCYVCTVPTLKYEDVVCSDCFDAFYNFGRTDPPLGSIDARERIRNAVGEALRFAQRVEYDRECAQSEPQPDERVVITAGFEWPVVLNADDHVEVRVNGKPILETTGVFFVNLLKRKPGWDSTFSLPGTTPFDAIDVIKSAMQKIVDDRAKQKTEKVEDEK